MVRSAHDIPVALEAVRRAPGSVPSDFVPPGDAEECATFVQQRLAAAQISHFGVRVHGAGEYPEKLRDATHPIEFLYYNTRAGGILWRPGPLCRTRSDPLT